MSTYAQAEGSSASVTVNVASTDVILLAPESDRNRDGRLSREEYDAARSSLTASVGEALRVFANGNLLDPESSVVKVESTEPFSDEPHALAFTFSYAVPEGMDLKRFRLDPNIFRSITVSPITGKPVVGAARNAVTVTDHGKKVTFIATGREVYDPRTAAGMQPSDTGPNTTSAVAQAQDGSSANGGTVAVGESSFWSLTWFFIKDGIEHILLGWDHVLFVVGLVLLANCLRTLIKVITAFTVAHSITLILTSLKIMRVDQPQVVEAIIAASVAYVGLENLLRLEKPVNWRWILVFAFGLLHGMGFAGVLANSLGEKMKEATSTELIVCLLTFNLGVEIGQLMIIAVLFPLLMQLRRNAPLVAKRTVIVGSAVVLFMGVSFLLDRTVIPGRLFYVEWFNG